MRTKSPAAPCCGRQLLACRLFSILAAAFSVTNPSASQAEEPGIEELAARTARLTREARYPQAMETAQQVAKPTRQANGDQGAEYARALGWIALLHQVRGQLNEAEPIFKRAIDILQKTIPAGHADKFAEAEAPLRCALTIRLKTGSSDHPDVAATTGKLAENLFKQGDHKRAETMFREALTMRRQLQPPIYIDIAVTLASFANNQIAIGKSAEAMEFFKEALLIVETTYPPGNSEEARLRMGLAEAYLRLGRHADALQQIRLATTIRIARGGTGEMTRLNHLKHLRFAWRATAQSSMTSGEGARELSEEAFLVAQRATQTDTATAVMRMAARFAAESPELLAMVRRSEEIEVSRPTLEQQLSRPWLKRRSTSRLLGAVRGDIG